MESPVECNYSEMFQTVFKMFFALIAPTLSRIRLNLGGTETRVWKGALEPESQAVF